MKFVPTLLSLLALNNVAFSVPAANPVASELITTNQSPYTEGIAHAELEKRISKLHCKAVARHSGLLLWKLCMYYPCSILIIPDPMYIRLTQISGS